MSRHAESTIHSASAGPLARSVRAIAVALLGALFLLPAPVALAQADDTVTIDQLLERVRSGWRAERAENERREKEFRAARDRQDKMLADAQATLAAEEARSDQLEKDFENNELTIAEKEDLLAERLGTLGELFGVVRQVAGDTRSQVENSMISAEFPGRIAELEALGQSKALPSIEKLEGLWATILQEMGESSKVTRFNTPVVRVNGEEVVQEVVRIGSFNAVSDGKYLKWSSDVQKLAEIGRQPAPKYVDTVDDLLSAQDGLVRFAVDPARGQILALLVSTPTFRERIAFGGTVGYAIIILGSLTFTFGIFRLAYVFLISRKVAGQKKNNQPDAGNPLGRQGDGPDRGIHLAHQGRLGGGPADGSAGYGHGNDQHLPDHHPLRHRRSQDDGKWNLRSAGHHDARPDRSDPAGADAQPARQHGARRDERARGADHGIDRRLGRERRAGQAGSAQRMSGTDRRGGGGPDR